MFQRNIGINYTLLILLVVWQNCIAQFHNPKINFDVICYRFNLNLSDSTSYLKGSCQIYLKNTTGDLPNINLELGNNLVVDSVLIENTKTSYTHFSDTLEINNSINNNDEYIKLNVFYKGFGQVLIYGLVNYNNKTENQKITYSFCEPFFSKYWFPVNQDLNDKADSVIMNVITDDHLMAISNGLLINKKNLTDHKIKYTWKTEYPIAYYLISVTVSDFLEYRNDIIIDSDTLLFVNYLYNSQDYLSKNKDIIDRTSEIINLYGDLFGKYPFINEKYGHAVAGIGGGMEHQTITTIGWFDFELIAHELAHQWWGDMVTCSSWNDIWINEGFATYSEYLAYEFLDSKQTADMWLSSLHDIITEKNEESIYVSDEKLSVNRIFDYRYSYAKGASVIHLLRQIINDDTKFFSILKNYLNNYAYKSAGVSEFQQVCEQIIQQDFSEFFNSWYYGEGFPVLSVKWKQIGNKLIVQAIKDRNYILNMKYKLIFFNDEELLVQHLHTQISQTDTFWVNSKVKNIIPNPIGDQLILVEDIEYINDNKLYDNLSFVYNRNSETIEFLFWGEKPNNIKIFDLNGRNYLNEMITNDYFSYSVKNVSDGMFIIIVEDKYNNIIREKIIKY